jgi:hypothetical protein
MASSTTATSASPPGEGFEESGAGWTVEDTPYRGFVVAPGHVVVGWTTAGTFDAFVAERVGTSWTGRTASPAGLSRLQVLTGVAAGGGTAAATIVSLTSRLYSATET